MVPRPKALQSVREIVDNSGCLCGVRLPDGIPTIANSSATTLATEAGSSSAAIPTCRTGAAVALAPADEMVRQDALYGLSLSFYRFSIPASGGQATFATDH